MGLISQVAGGDLHLPLGVDPSPLPLPDNNATGYQITNNAGTTAYLTLDTTTGAIRLIVETGMSAGLEIKSKLKIATDAELEIVERASDPTNVANSGLVYTKETGGATELYYINSEGNVTQLTSGSAGVPGGKYTTESVSSSPFSVTAEQRVLLVSTAAARTINLRAAATAGAGAHLWVKDVTGSAGTNNITIDADGSETIDGATTLVISTNYGAVHLVCDGTGWYAL